MAKGGARIPPAEIRPFLWIDLVDGPVDDAAEIGHQLDPIRAPAAVRQEKRKLLPVEGELAQVIGVQERSLVPVDHPVDVLAAMPFRGQRRAPHLDTVAFSRHLVEELDVFDVDVAAPLEPKVEL